MRVLGVDLDAAPVDQVEVPTIEIEPEQPDLTQMVVLFDELAHAVRLYAHPLEGSLREESVGMPARLFGHVVLEQAVSEVHGGTERLAPAGHVLEHEVAEVDDELQIQMIDGLTSPAWTGGVAAHGPAKVAERRVRGIDQLEDELPARHPLLEAIYEDRVAFHLGELQGRRQLTDDRGA